MNIKKGDNVIVLIGKEKGKKGKVILSIPRENKVVIEGLNIIKRHKKPAKTGQKGQIVEKAMPIHVSNVALVDKAEKSAAKKK